MNTIKPADPCGNGDAFLGLDIGSTASKGVLLSSSGDVLGHKVIPTGTGGAIAADCLRDALLSEASGARIVKTIATGYGRNLVGFADKVVTEITCHALGVFRLHPDAATVIDIGGQDAKVIRLGANGQVDDFVMNDRCAAGTGAFLDVIARRLQLNVNTEVNNAPLSPLSASACPCNKQAIHPLPISSTCVVFAESEVVGHLAQGKNPAAILAGVHQSIARRTVTMIRQVKAQGPFYFCGGVALNSDLALALQKELDETVTQANTPQFCGAFGAAQLAIRAAAK